MYTVTELTAFVSFLYVQITNAIIKKAALLICVAFILFTFLHPHNSQLTDSIPIGIETIIVLVLSYYFLYEKTNDTTTLYIYSTFSFWVVIGMVLYLSASFFTYLFASFLPAAEMHQYWVITNLSSFSKNVLFAIGIMLNSKPPKKLPPSDYEFSSLN